MLGIKKISAWEFKGSGSGALGAGCLSIEGGMVQLGMTDTDKINFYYGAVGVGYSRNIKLPSQIATLASKIKIPNKLINILNKAKNMKVPKPINKVVGKVSDKISKYKIDGSVAPSTFPSLGMLLVLDTVNGDELSVSDINGACAFFEAGAGKRIGVSVYGMLVGMDEIMAGKYLWACGFGPVFASHYAMKLISTAKGLLLMGGANISWGASIAVYLGYLGAIPKKIVPIPDMHPLPERPKHRPSSKAQRGNRASAAVQRPSQHPRIATPIKQVYTETDLGYSFEACGLRINTDQPQDYAYKTCAEIHAEVAKFEVEITADNIEELDTE